MSKTEIPRFVPLPMVSDHTEDITFGGLNLPIGFDDERLLVNIRGIDRIRAAAGLGQVSIFCKSPNSDQQSFTIAGIDVSGTASLAKTASNADSPLAKGSLRFDNGSNEYFGKPDAVVQINSKEIDERLKASDMPRSMLDSKLRAKALNVSVKRGLSEAALQANIDKPRTMAALKAYAFLGVIAAISEGGGADLPRDAVLFTFGTALNYLGVMRGVAEENIVRSLKDDKSKTSLKDALVAYRHSIFIGDAFDRYLGAKFLLGTTRLMKDRK